VAPELLTLLIAERLAKERLDRLRGYPDDVVEAAESLWREAAQAVADYRAKQRPAPYHGRRWPGRSAGREERPNGDEAAYSI
jgi:hypothetical protein